MQQHKVQFHLQEGFVKIADWHHCIAINMAGQQIINNKYVLKYIIIMAKHVL